MNLTILNNENTWSPQQIMASEQWTQWKWQQQNRITTSEQCSKWIPLSENEKKAIGKQEEGFRFAVTPYYLSLINPNDPNDPIRKQTIPTLDEFINHSYILKDPQAEEKHSPVKNLVHRYHDRALIYTTHNCPIYCRYCFRKRKVSDPLSAPHKNEFAAAIEYISKTPQIKEVILSGGDPLSLSNEKLETLMSSLYKIPHIDLIRIASRNPVTLPFRIDQGLIKLLKKFPPIYFHTHFNHPNECTPEAANALSLLADAGCVLKNQTVLLKGINDNLECIKKLNRWLVKHRCPPYYIFLCDPSPGTHHFKTSIQCGLDIIQGLRGHMSGLTVPHLIIDLPNGGGKVSVQPEFLVKQEGKKWTFRNYKGHLHEYFDL